MRPVYPRKTPPKWYQQPVSEVLNQGLEFTLSTLLSVGNGVLGCWKNRVAWALTLTIPLLVIVSHRLAMARVAAKQPAHLKEIIDELSSIRIPTGKVVPNHADTKLLYLKYTTKDTWAVFLLNTTTRKSQLVSEVVNEAGTGELAANRTVTILGWSPRDEYFAYARSGRREIVVCDGDSGAELGKGKFRQPVSTSAWLSSRTLLCSDGDQLAEFSKSPTGWNRNLFYESPRDSAKTDDLARNKAAHVHDDPAKETGAKQSKIPAIPQVPDKKKVLLPNTKLPAGKITSLAAWGFDAAVWQQSNTIYVRERGRALNAIWHATNCTLIEFSYSASAGEFLLHCKDQEGEFLINYFPRILSGHDTFTNLVRLDTSEYRPVEVQFINNAQGYAYLNQNEDGANQLVIKLFSSKPPVELPCADEFNDFFINGVQLYGITASGDEPPGIWKCDLRSRAVDCLVPSIEKPFKYAAHAPVLEGYVTNAAGEQLTYYLLEPVRTDGNRKHPLVVGIMGAGELGNVWDRWAQGIANYGGYFVSMDRRKRSQANWADDAFCACEFLSKQFAVDTNNVYLLGVSAGSYAADHLLSSHPDVWKGAFLFSMQNFPNLDQAQTHSIALDVGELDIEKVEARLLGSQDHLAARGIRPILMVHPGAGHIVRSIRLEQERMEQIATFIRQP